jgi:hypothetical protein
MVKIGNTKMTWNRPNDTCSGVTPLLDHDVSINFLSLPIAVLGIVVSFLEPNDGPLSLHQTCRHFQASCNWKLMVQHCNCAWNNDTNLPDAMSWNHHLVVRWTKILCRMHRDVAVDLFWKNPAISPMILRELLLKAINLGDVKRVKEVLKDHRCILKGALRKAFVEKRHEMVPMLKEDPRARKYWKCCCENAATASPSNDDLVVVPCLHRPCVNEFPGFWGSFDADIVCQDCVDQFRCAICEDYGTSVDRFDVLLPQLLIHNPKSIFANLNVYLNYCCGPPRMHAVPAEVDRDTIRGGSKEEVCTLHRLRTNRVRLLLQSMPFLLQRHLQRLRHFGQSQPQ